MKEVKFIKDFANKKVGEIFICDSILANTLVEMDKVAVYVKQKK